MTARAGGALTLLGLLVGCTVGEGKLGFEDNGTATTIAAPTSTTTDTATDDDQGTSAGITDLGMADDGLGSGCADVMATIEPVIPTIVLVVDQSGSMGEDFGGISRWQAVSDAMFDPVDGVVTQLESSIRFGMALYTSNNGMFGGECPMLSEVAPAFDNRDAMNAAFTAPVPEGDTPTGESVAAVAAALALEPDTARAIVLATDGEPDTCAVPDPQEGQPESVAAVADAHAQGIDTFVISVGGQINAQHLQDLANVGVGKAPGDPDPAPFFEALDSAELIAAFGEIVNGFVSCEFAIDGVVDLEAACQGTVLLDGVPIECGTDWNVPEESTLELIGAACDTLQDGEDHSVDASFPCTVIMPIP